MDVKDVIELVKPLAWPVTVIVTLLLLHRALADLIRTIASRAIKFSAFKVEIELAKLTPAQTNLATTVDGLRQVVIPESGAGSIATGTSISGAADFVLIGLGADADQKWLTSRLFLVAAILERSRVVRCIVFTGEKGVFLGAATPRDVRAGLGTKFPEYERALLRAYGVAATVSIEEFRSGNLSPTVVDTITHTFLNPTGEIVRPENSPPTGNFWTYLSRTNDPSTWELAEWVTAGGLASILIGRFANGSVRASPGPASEEVIRAIVHEPGAFVGLIDDQGQFQALCDRSLIVDKIARSATDQTTIS